MSLLHKQPLKLPCFRKPVIVRSAPPLLSNNGLTSLTLNPPGVLICSDPCGGDRGRVTTTMPGDGVHLSLEAFEKRWENDAKMRDELFRELGAIGSSNGWLPTLKDGVLGLRDMNMNTEVDPKRILLPPLVTLPHCQTQYVTNVAMSSSPEEEDCVVAVKYLGPQLSFCRPAQSKSEWINVRIESPCFFSSPVMFSKKEGMFRIAGSGGHLIGSLDRHKHSKKPKFQRLWFQNPKMTETQRDLLDSCYTSEHLVESEITGETFMVKLYKKTANIIEGIPRMHTEAVMVFKIDEEGNAVYTEDIGNQSIYVTSSEALCNLFSTRLCLCRPNYVKINDVDERRNIKLADPKWKRRQSST
ncbi:PREDICTED: uncharacterized protein LOC104728976 [Camelina sativa]|uniref:Uncharacterized protein LOC104728976 n=1 Tax=Camelina sativa TaxID=90675 RepID=A0ABM0UTN7_CAMSA|nr:PREDICTED: uncharacterized protein LOC104728976 [Camelina sativa]